MTRLKSSLGFSALEALLILVIVGILGFTGWFVYHSQKVATKDYNSHPSTATTTAKPAKSTGQYAGWKSYTTKYERLSFKYPSNWKLVDQSNTDSTDVTPGQDSVTLISNDSLEVTIGAGAEDFDVGNSTVRILSATPLSILGRTNYLTFTSSDGAFGGTGTGGALITTKDALPSLTNFPISRNIHYTHATLSNPALQDMPTPFDLISLNYDDVNQNGTHEYSVSAFQQDPNYKAALLILGSLTH